MNLVLCRKRIEEKDTELSKLREIMKEKIEQEKVMKGDYFDEDAYA